MHLFSGAFKGRLQSISLYSFIYQIFVADSKYVIIFFYDPPSAASRISGRGCAYPIRYTVRIRSSTRQGLLDTHKTPAGPEMLPETLRG